MIPPSLLHTEVHLYGDDLLDDDLLDDGLGHTDAIKIIAVLWIVLMLLSIGFLVFAACQMFD